MSMEVPLWTIMLKRAYSVVSSATSVSRIRLLVSARFSLSRPTWLRVTFSRWMFAPILARISVRFWMAVWILLNAEEALVVVVLT